MPTLLAFLLLGLMVIGSLYLATRLTENNDAIAEVSEYRRAIADVSMRRAMPRPASAAFC
jgi:CHASE3 domain sensor protein